MLSTKPPARNWFANILILMVVAVYATFTVIHCQKWKKMAEINAIVLDQIKRQHIAARPNTFFFLTYIAADRTHLFPDGFASWGFPYALKVLYADPTVNGLIVRGSIPCVFSDQRPIVHFRYTIDDWNRPHVIKMAGDFQEMDDDQ